MVALIPFKRLEFDTKLNSQELAAVLKNSITSLKWSERAAKPFMGRVDKTRFFVMRALYVGYGVLPVAYGQFFKMNGQTRVRILISFPPLDVFAAPIIFVAPGLPLYVLGELLHLGVSLALLGIILSYALVLTYFNGEASTLSKFLFDTLK